MKKWKPSHAVISESGPASVQSEPEPSGNRAGALALTQSDAEPAHAFAARVEATLAAHGRLSGVTLVMGAKHDRQTLAARRRILDRCLRALDGVPDRELTLSCEPTARGKVPHWAGRLLAGLEDHDPALRLYVDCAAGGVAA